MLYRAVPCRREVRAVLGMRAPRGAQRCGDRCWGRAGPELRGYRWDRARSGAPWGGAACGPGRAASRGRRRVGAVPYGAVTYGAALGAAALYFLRGKKKDRSSLCLALSSFVNIYTRGAGGGAETIVQCLRAERHSRAMTNTGAPAPNRAAAVRSPPALRGRLSSVFLLPSAVP